MSQKPKRVEYPDCIIIWLPSQLVQAKMGEANRKSPREHWLDQNSGITKAIQQGNDPIYSTKAT
jgi:hypothetical protein